MNLKQYSKLLTYVFTLGCLAFFVVSVIERREEATAALLSYVASPLPLVVVVALLPVNILLEALRWRTLTIKNNPHPFSEDITSTLRAIIFGNSTPANIGEHAGRAWNAKNKNEAVSLSILASVLQTITITLGGVVGVGALWILDIEIPMHALIASSVILAIEFLAFLIILFFFRPLYRRTVETLCSLSVKIIIKTLLLNILRLLVFSLQLFILLGLSSASAFFLVLIYYFFITFLPRINIIDVGVKGSIALFTFSSFVGVAEINVAVVVIWVVNILVPVGMGIVCLRRS